MDVVTVGSGVLLALCIAIALGFEFVNGFHDTANAVATVIYTRSLKPGIAVLWSGFVNFLGVLSVLSTGGAVAFGIVYLLPTDLLVKIQGGVGIAMILSILITAVLWNLATWYVGLPSSSSHTLIGSILGVGAAYGLLSGKGILGGMNVDKAMETLRALLFAPLIGFTVAAILLLIARALIHYPAMFKAPEGDNPPPWPVRLLLITTCTGVSYFHGSNDGQKGIGLMMLILIALMPSQFTVNPTWTGAEIEKARAAIVVLQPKVEALIDNPNPEIAKKATDTQTALASIATVLANRADLKSLPQAEKLALRSDVLKANSGLKKLAKSIGGAEGETIDDARKKITGSVEHVAIWVVVAVALALGAGTTIGWKRIVVTVGEKIGKSHLTYAQGAAAELTAMMTILGADKLGVPVSTTHILSSGVAGTMAASGAGIQPKTVRNIFLAWALTLPVTMLVAGLLFALTGGRML